jgi:hypothetical protein
VLAGSLGIPIDPSAPGPSASAVPVGVLGVGQSRPVVGAVWEFWPPSGSDPGITRIVLREGSQLEEDICRRV